MAKEGVQGKLVQPSFSSILANVGANEEFDRSEVVVATATGETVSSSAQIKVIQLGMREPFIPFDEETCIETQDGEQFGVLKK